jgi:prohibitin 2
MSNRSPIEEYAERARRFALQNRRRVPFGGGGGGGNPLGLAALAFFGIGGAVLLQNSLFNVDGGHRAIKYTRLAGVSKEIYSEGMAACSDVVLEIRMLMTTLQVLT